MDIYPSILETNIDDFITTFNKLSALFNHFQIDIADGLLVPNKTIQIEDIVKQVTSNKIQVTNKLFEFHMMVNDYQKEIEKLDKLKNILNILSILIHLKSLIPPNPPNSPNFPFGIVLNPEDDVVSNFETISHFPTVQLMTVHPGKQGSPFFPDQLEKINQLREADYKGKIILDGGINDQTLPIILKNKYLPDAICPGSYFTKASDPASNLAKLNSLIAYNKFS